MRLYYTNKIWYDISIILKSSILGTRYTTTFDSILISYVKNKLFMKKVCVTVNFSSSAKLWVAKYF